MRVWWFAAAGLVVVGLGVAGFALVGPGFAARQDVQYLTTAAAVTNVTAEVVVNGTVQPARTDSLAFGSAVVEQPASQAAAATGASQGTANSPSGIRWPVSSVAVAVGDHVAKGAPLASATTADVSAQIAVAQAQVDTAQAKVDAGGTDQAVANAKLALLDAKTRLAELKAALAHASLTAPEAGVITAVNVAAGVDAPSGPAVVMVSDVMVAAGIVTETDVAAVTAGQKATVTVTAVTADLAGSVSYVSPTGSSTSGVVGFAIEVSLDSVPAGVRPGMSADITVVTAEASGVLAIPSVALNGTVGAYTVTVLGSNGTTTVRTVSVGLVTNNLAEITGGLSAGDRVVTGTASTQLTTTNTGGGFRGGFGGGGLGGGGFGGGPN